MSLQYFYHILNCFCTFEIPQLLRTVYCPNVMATLQDVICLALSDVEIANVFTIFVVIVVIVLENWEDAHREDDDSKKK